MSIRPSRLLLLLLVLACIGGVGHWYAATLLRELDVRELGPAPSVEWARTVGPQLDTIRALRDSNARLDTAFAVERARLDSATQQLRAHLARLERAARVDAALHDSLATSIDTTSATLALPPFNDTTVAVPALEAYVAQVERTVGACSTALATCEQRATRAESLVVSASAAIVDERRRNHGRRAQLASLGRLALAFLAGRASSSVR